MRHYFLGYIKKMSIHTNIGVRCYTDTVHHIENRTHGVYIAHMLQMHSAIFAANHSFRMNKNYTIYEMRAGL